MAYRIESPDGLERTLRRIATEQTSKAIRSIDRRADDVPGAVHDVRKRCKKIRGLLRLFRASFDAYRVENEHFRDTARLLSGVRDAQTLIDCAAGLMARFEGRRESAAVRRIERALRAGGESAADARSLGGRLDECRDRLDAGLTRIESWSLKDDGFQAIRAGLCKTYRRGRRAMETAIEAPSGEAFHEWRKRVKYTGYHMRLLGPVWPGVIPAIENEFAALSDLLGEEHDLAVFRAAITADPGRFGSADAVLAMIGRRRSELRAMVAPMGRRLYAEGPRRWTRRLGVAWMSWESLRTIDGVMKEDPAAVMDAAAGAGG